MNNNPPRVKKKALDPAKLSLASMQTGGQVETRHKRLAEAIVCRLPTYLSCIKSSLSFSLLTFVFAVMNCNCTRRLVHYHYYYSHLLFVCPLPPHHSFFLFSHTHTHSLSLILLTLSLSLFLKRLRQGQIKDEVDDGEKGNESDLLPIKGLSSQAMWPASTWMHHCRKFPGSRGSRQQ